MIAKLSIDNRSRRDALSASACRSAAELGEVRGPPRKLTISSDCAARANRASQLLALVSVTMIDSTGQGAAVPASSLHSRRFARRVGAVSRQESTARRLSVAGRIRIQELQEG